VLKVKIKAEQGNAEREQGNGRNLFLNDQQWYGRKRMQQTQTKLLINKVYINNTVKKHIAKFVTTETPTTPRIISTSEPTNTSKRGRGMLR